MSTQYDVTLALHTTGSLDAHLTKVGSAASLAEKATKRVGDSAKSVGSAFESMGASVGSVLGSIADRAMDVGFGLIKIGGAALLAGAAYGVGSLNAQLETTQISLASIFQAQGLSPNFQSATSVAAGQIEKMKKDVMTLPGTFGQLAQLMQTTATTGISAGMDADQLRKFAGRTMLTASIVAPTIDNNLLSKEIVNLLAGKAGTHNILGLRLGLQGDEAKKFNALSPEQRLAELNKIYDKYKDATDAISTSWRAQFTSLKDNALYQILQPITQPLFEHVKADLVKVNEFFTNNKVMIEHFVDIVGYRLAEAWDKAVEGARRMEPVLAHIGGLLERANPHQMGEDLKKFAVEAVAVKMAPSLITGTSSLLGGAMAGEGVGGAIAGVLGGPATMVALAATIVTVIGAVENLTNKFSAFYESSHKSIDRIVEDGKALGDSLSLIWDHLQPFREIAGSLLLTGLKDLADTLSFTAKMVEVFLVPVRELGELLAKITPGASRNYRESMQSEGKWRDATELSFKSHLMDLDEHLRNNPQPAPREFGTTIQKVEIVVKGSDDPSRVARRTLDAIARLGQHKLSSPYVARP